MFASTSDNNFTTFDNNKLQDQGPYSGAIWIKYHRCPYTDFALLLLFNFVEDDNGVAKVTWSPGPYQEKHSNI